MSDRRATYNRYWRADTPSDEYPYVIAGDTTDEEDDVTANQKPEASELAPARLTPPPPRHSESPMFKASKHAVHFKNTSPRRISESSSSFNPTSSDEEETPKSPPLEQPKSPGVDLFPPIPLSEIDGNWSSDSLDLDLDPNTIEDYEKRMYHIANVELTLKMRAERDDSDLEERLAYNAMKAEARDAARRKKIDDIRRLAAGRCTLDPPKKRQWPIPESSNPTAVQHAQLFNDVHAEWADLNQRDDLFEEPSATRAVSKEEKERIRGEIIASLDRRDTIDPPLDWDTIDHGSTITVALKPETKEPIVRRYFEFYNQLWLSEGPKNGKKTITHLRKLTWADKSAFDAKKDPLYLADNDEIQALTNQLIWETDLIKGIKYEPMETQPADEPEAAPWCMSTLTGKHYFNKMPPPEELEKDHLLWLQLEERRKKTWRRDYPMFNPNREEELKAAKQKELHDLMMDDLSTDDDDGHHIGSLVVVKDDEDIDGDDENESNTEVDDRNDESKDNVPDETMTHDSDAVEMDNPDPIPIENDIEMVAAETHSEVHTAIEAAVVPESPVFKSPLREPSVLSLFDNMPVDEESPPPPTMPTFPLKSKSKSPSVAIESVSAGRISPCLTAIETVDTEPIKEIQEDVPREVEPISEPAPIPPHVEVSLATAIPFDDIPNPTISVSEEEEAPTASITIREPSVQNVPQPPDVLSEALLERFGQPVRCSDRIRNANWKQPIYVPSQPVTPKPSKSTSRRRPAPKKAATTPKAAPPAAPKATPKPKPPPKPKTAKPKPYELESSDSSSDGDNTPRRVGASRRPQPAARDATFRCKPAHMDEIKNTPIRRSTRQRKSVERYGATKSGRR